MHLEQFIETYGYAALFVGTFFEGEAILIMGGFLAHRGYLYLPGVIAAASLGTLANAQLFYWVGRTKGEVFLARHRSWRRRTERLRSLFHAHRTAVIVGFRFLYGMRTASPLLIGMSNVPARQFAVLNAFGAVVWALVVGLIGYSVGLAVKDLLGRVKQYELTVLGVIAAVAVLVWIVHFVREGRRR